MVEDAVGPDENAGTACDRVFVTPDTGSALELGQRLRGVFFFDDQVPASPPELCPAWASCWLLVTVDVEEFDAREEEELERWTCFRGINIRETSSAFTEDRAPCPPLPVLYHPKRDPDCTLGGDATAVMEKDVGSGSTQWGVQTTIDGRNNRRSLYGRQLERSDRIRE
jgi:hypothetical protein